MTVGVPLPVTLPQSPNVNGLQGAPRPNIVSFQPEVGEAKVRMRGTARGKLLSCTFTYSQEEFDIWEGFFEDDLADGSLRMTWTDPVRGDAADWRFDPDNPYSFVPHADTGAWDVTWRLTRVP